MHTTQKRNTNVLVYKGEMISCWSPNPLQGTHLARLCLLKQVNNCLPNNGIIAHEESYKTVGGKLLKDPLKPPDPKPNE